MKHRVYWVFEHILKEYVFLFSFVRSYSRPLPKKFANKSKKGGCVKMQINNLTTINL